MFSYTTNLLKHISRQGHGLNDEIMFEWRITISLETPNSTRFGEDLLSAMMLSSCLMLLCSFLSQCFAVFKNITVSSTLIHSVVQTLCFTPLQLIKPKIFD